MMLFKMLGTAALVACASASEGGEVCDELFNQASFAAATTTDPNTAICSALAEYSKCLGALSGNDAFLHEPRLTAYQQTVDCGAYDHTPPIIKTTDKHLEFIVDDQKEATFYRHRRETVNVFGMRKDIDDLEGEFATSELARAASEKAIKDSQDNLDAKLTQDVKTANADLLDAMLKLDTKLTGAGDTLESALTDKLSKTSDDLTGAISKLQKDLSAETDALSSKVDQVEKDLNAAVDKKIGDIPDAIYRQRWVHWGEKECPTGHEKWFDGIVYGGHYGHGGSGDLECIINKGRSDGYGGRETGTSSLDLLYPMAVDHNHGTDIDRGHVLACATCIAPMPCIEARGMKQCPAKYKMTMKGYLMGSHHGHRLGQRRDCVSGTTKNAGYGGYQDGWLYTTRLHRASQNSRNQGGGSIECGLCCWSG